MKYVLPYQSVQKRSNSKKESTVIRMEKPSYSNTLYERYTLNKMVQEKDESFDDFLTKIQSQSDKCEFANVHDSLLLDKIIVGIRNNIVREELLSDADLTLGRAIQVCRGKWMIDEHNTTFTVAAKGTNYKSSTSRKRKSNDENTIYTTLVSEFPSNLETINDDCLHYIFKYLNIMDIGKLSVTCKRLNNFANLVWFPKTVRQITIRIDNNTVNLIVPLNKAFSTELTLKRLENSFNFFGEFVEDLTLFEIGLIYATVLERSENLKTLRFKNCRFNPVQTHELQDLIERLQKLEELHFLECSGITNNWPAAINSISKVQKLILTAKDKISGNFLEYFCNFSSLTIDFNYFNEWQTEDLAKMFENNGQRLKHLQLSHLSLLDGYESVGRLITNKLHNLESVGLGFCLTYDSKYMIELSHLRSLSISCHKCSINSLLRTLSDNGIVEELTISSGVFDNEDENAKPFIFNRLQRFCCNAPENSANFLNLLTRSQMPIVQSFELNDIDYVASPDLQDLLKFIESKKSLKSICLSFDEDTYNIEFALMRQIIGILKDYCTPKRLFFNLYMHRYPFQLNNEYVSQIRNL